MKKFDTLSLIISLGCIKRLLGIMLTIISFMVILSMLISSMVISSGTGMSWAAEQQTEAFKKYGQEFKGKIERRYEDSREWWPETIKPPKGTPNALIFVLDDVGFGHLGSYGGLIKTPNIDRLAKKGLRYNNFHTTALCSPSRASLLAGRNSHRIGLGSHSFTAMGFPGYNAFTPESAKSLAKHTRKAGFVNYFLGKWDHAPASEVSSSGPFDHWPSGEGFDHFYGFMAAEVDNYRSVLYRDHHPIEDWQDKSGYHLSEALADEAIRNITSHKSVSPDKPFMMYWAPVANHAPHHAPKEYIKQYKGKFDIGWDKAREIIWKRQLEMGIIPPGTKLTKRPGQIPAWDSLKPEEKKLYTRQMEVFAAMLTHADDQIGRIIDTLKRTGQIDNTIIMVVSDNGASSEGGLGGTFNEYYFLEGKKTPFEVNMKHYKGWGGPTTYPHFHAGWALAGNTPFRYFKMTIHNGGIADPLIVHWPKEIKAKGEIRSQYHHIIDIAPTLLDVTGTKFSNEIDGVKQLPMDGLSMVYSFNTAKATDRRTEQYYEMFGNRGIYKDGWKAVTLRANRMPWEFTSRARRPPVEDDVWELYNVEKDFSETNNLAEKFPNKLKALKNRWDELAWEYNVYPLGGVRGSHKKWLFGDRKEFVYYWPGAQRIPEIISPPVKNRSHTIETRLDLTGNEEGVIVACGGLTGGYTMFIRDHRLNYEYNMLGEEQFRMVSPMLPTGKVDLKFKFIRTGYLTGKGELQVNGRRVAGVDIPRTARTVFSVAETFDIGIDKGTPVSKGYRIKNHYPYTGKIDKVIVRLID